MKIFSSSSLEIWLRLILLIAAAILPANVWAVPLPAASALPLGSSTTRGFIVRTVQAPTGEIVDNSLLRAVRQINGTLPDSLGGVMANDAIAGPGAGGSYTLPTINFELNATPFDLTDPAGGFLASFTPDLFPGIPGNGGLLENFAVEVIGFLELTAGSHTFGVSVAADRTDVNNDDSYAVFVAKNPHDFFGLQVGEFSRNAAPFAGLVRNENQWTVEVTTPGIYPFRLLYWQTGLGGNLQWYTVDGTDRDLVNDPNTPTAIKSYIDTNVAAATGPYVGEARPISGSAGNSAAAPIEAVIFDGATATVPAANVQLRLDGALTAATVTRTAPRVFVALNPNPNRTIPTSQVQLDYTDSTAAAWQNQWSFGINVSGGSGTTVTGQWDFNSGTLAATVGQPLQYLDGPTGLTQQGTKFGTTTSLGVPSMSGREARIMEVPGNLVREIGYVMTHGIAPNGGGTRVNQYTLIMDVLVEATGPGAASLLQINPANTDDGDLFWQGNNFGQGEFGYNGTGQFTTGQWHRVVAAYDEAATPPVVTKYVDCIKQDDWTANQGLDNIRRALLPTAVLFGDGDQDERRRMWVNSIQIRSGKMTDAEIVALGGPSADGIPLVVPATTVTGQWDFERGNLAATVGKSLTYFDGPGGLTEAGTQFGVISEFPDLPLINGQNARIMRVPPDVVRAIGYVMDHGIKPNGGGTRVNQFTLIMDVLVAAVQTPTAASLLQTSSLTNEDDGDLFWQGSNFGQGEFGYNGTGQFTAGAWHRVVAAYDEAATPPVVTKFVDGIKQDDWTANQGIDNVRRALQPTAILFADGDQDERREMFVNSIQVRSGKMTDAEIVHLGGPEASGIPVAVPLSPVSGQWDFDRGNLAATIGKPLTYFDGAGGLTELGTMFGTCTELGVALINGVDSRIMRVPPDLDNAIGYVMDHGLKPNGGGTRVNQYTLLFDIMVASVPTPGAASLLQLSSLTNADDGDLFWQGSNFGQGEFGYNGTGQFTAGEWHRVIAAYDEAATPPVVTKFVDGIKQDDWTANQGLDNVRRAMQPTAILFADGDKDERREMWVDSIQVRAGKMTDDEMIALGAPSGMGLPVGPVATVVPPAESTDLNIAVSADGTTIALSWPALSQHGTVYTLEMSPTMLPGSWTLVPTIGTSATINVTGAVMFFRLGY